MSAFKLSLNEIKQNIYAARLSEAMDGLLKLEPEIKSEIRERNHIQGIILMRQGQFEKAIEIFLRTMQTQGHHVSLIIDLATCYYLTGQIQNWLRMMDLAEYEFRQVEHLISWERKIDFLLILGKFREEQGALSEALALHEANLRSCQLHITEDMGRIETIRTLTQVLRLQSQYGMSSKTHDLYMQLIHHSSRDTDWDCAFEVEHALMIFEARHFGLEQGLLRLQKLMLNPLVTTHEAALLFSDITYEALCRGQVVPLDTLTRFQKLEGLSPYDGCILRMAQGKLPSDLEMLDWPEALSPSAHLRLLALMIQRSPNGSEIQKKYVFLLHGFSAKSKKIWLQWSGDSSHAKTSAVLYNRQTQVLTYEDKTMDLSRKSAFREMIELLVEKPQINILDAIESLWQGSTDEHDISRLRMRVRRMNDEIERTWGFSSFFQISESQLRCSFEIKST